MAKNNEVLVSPTGTHIIGTLERLTGYAVIESETVRNTDTGFEFEYEGTTEVYWDEQKTVERDGERIFVDRNGDEFREGELRLVAEEAAETVINTGERACVREEHREGSS